MANTVHEVDSSEPPRGLQENTLPVALLVSTLLVLDEALPHHEPCYKRRDVRFVVLIRKNADVSNSGINRHKQEILTPALHACQYSPDSNRYDLLPFLRPYVQACFSHRSLYLGDEESSSRSKRLFSYIIPYSQIFYLEVATLTPETS